MQRILFLRVSDGLGTERSARLEVSEEYFELLAAGQEVTFSFPEFVDGWKATLIIEKPSRIDETGQDE